MSVISIRGLGDGHNVLSPSVLRTMMARPVASLQTAVLAPGWSAPGAYIPPSSDVDAGGDYGGDGGADAAVVETCACMVDKMAEATAGDTGLAIPAEMIAQLNMMCIANSDALRVAAREAGINLDPCKPWYMRKTTWIIGGVVALVGVGAVVALR